MPMATQRKMFSGCGRRLPPDMPATAKPISAAHAPWKKPRITSMWRALRAVDADIYYCRSASVWLWLVTEFCRRHGKRSLYAGASDVDFLPEVGGQIR